MHDLSRALILIVFLCRQYISAHPLDWPSSEDLGSFQLRVASSTSALDGWSVQHIYIGGRSGILQIQQPNTPASNAYVHEGRLIVDDGVELVLSATLAQVTTKGSGEGSSGFAVNIDEYIAVGRSGMEGTQKSGVEGFLACPAIVPVANSGAGKADCASIPTPCSEQTYTLWYGSLDGEQEKLPIEGCQKVKLKAVGKLGD